MKLVVAAVSLLACGSIAAAKAPEVEVVQYQVSGRNVRLTLKANGRAAANVKIIVLTADDQLLYSLSSHDQSRCFLTASCARANTTLPLQTSRSLRADLFLIVSAKTGDKPDEFAMQLTAKPPLPPSFEEQLSAAEKMAASETLGKLAGTVRDPSGANIRGCQIRIFEKGFRDSRHTLNLISDDDGTFFGDLGRWKLYSSLFDCRIPYSVSAF